MMFYVITAEAQINPLGEGVYQCHAYVLPAFRVICADMGRILTSTRIFSNICYPGEIKVNIIRENRVVEFAR